MTLSQDLRDLGFTCTEDGVILDPIKEDLALANEALAEQNSFLRQQLQTVRTTIERFCDVKDDLEFLSALTRQCCAKDLAKLWSVRSKLQFMRELQQATKMS